MANNSRLTPEQMIAGAVRETVRLATMIKFYDPEFDPSLSSHWLPYVDLYMYYNHADSPTNREMFAFQLNVFEQFYAFFHSPVSPIEEAARTRKTRASPFYTTSYRIKHHVLEGIVGTNLLRGIPFATRVPSKEWMVHFYRIRNEITDDNS